MSALLEKGQVSARLPRLEVQGVYDAMCTAGAPDTRKVATVVARLVDKLNYTSIPMLNRDGTTTGQSRSILGTGVIHQLCDFSACGTRR